MSSALAQVKKAKEASLVLASINTEAKNMALKNIARAMRENKNKIIKENKKDVDKAKKSLSEPLVNR